jgi:hypothetical protein
LRHEDVVTSAAFSRDGKWVVTASWDQTARVWEAASGKEVGQPLRHDSVVDSAVFSPDGKRVVTASWDQTARVWEAASGKEVGQPLRHEGYVYSAAFSPDGKWVVTASWDQTARVWESFLSSGKDSSLAAEAAEVIGGYEVSDPGTLGPANDMPSRLARLHEIADRATAGDGTFASLLKWFFTPFGQRTMSPGSRTRVCDYIRELVTSGHAVEAEKEFPGHDRYCGPQ